MDTKHLNNIFARTMYGMVIVAMILSVSTVAYASPSSVSGGGLEKRGTIIIVTTNLDLVAADGACSLREAIISANTNLPSGDESGECPAGTEDLKDIITLAAEESYSLTIDGIDEDEAYSGDLDIWDNSATTDLIIGVQGDGNATISQDSEMDDRVFDILGATVNIKGVTITGGGSVESGGGIQNTGNLTIDTSVISDNAADFGGGIANSDGTVKLNNTIVVNNSGRYAGGGVLNSGEFKMNSSIITDNTCLDGGGGGIWNNGDLRMSASILSFNQASGGGALFNEDAGVVRISANTKIFGNITDNGGGGGIVNGGTGMLIIESSTISNNTSSENGGGIQTGEGATTIIRNGSEVNGNSAGWGGGGLWNMGTLTLESSTVSDNAASDTDGGGGGITTGGDSGLLTVSASTINNNTAGWGAGIFGWGNGTVTIQNGSSISGNTASNDGGGVWNQGVLTIDASTLSANSTSHQGGALYSTGSATITNSALIGGTTEKESNIAGDGGGGLFNIGTLTVQDSIVTGNHATYYGGGLFNWIGGTLTVDNSIVSSNSAKEGGGLHNKEDSTTLIQNSIISDNYAEWSAGGIDNWGTITITGSALRENTSPGEGDAITNSGPEGSTASVTTSCIVGNGDTAVINVWPISLDFTGNWWGASSGPSGLGPGSGDSVGDNVDFSSWLTMPPDFCPTHWVAAYTYDPGTWSEGTHKYHFEATWNGGSETTNEIFFNVSGEAKAYDGYVLLRPGAVRAGEECAAIDAIRPDQPTRFLAGYVTDNPMTYSEALAYFNSLSASAVWDDDQSAGLMRQEIIPFNLDDWVQYVCTFTSP